MAMYDLILFDLDGTLVNSEEGVTKSVRYALEKCGIIENDPKNLLRFIGPPLIDSFTEFYGMSVEEATEAIKHYRVRYDEKGVYENEIMPGVENALKILKENGKKIALATSKPHIYAKEVLKSLNLDKYFDILVGAEFDGTRNDKAEVVKEVLAQAGECKSPVMVGDRMYDILGAKKNNVPCIGVSFGFAPEGELEEYGAVKIADSTEELIEFLLTE